MEARAAAAKANESKHKYEENLEKAFEAFEKKRKYEETSFKDS